jgi:hypothetical protein
MRRIWMIGPAVVAAGLMVGCGDESPTGVGSELLGPGVETYEVILDATDFLVADTTFNQIGRLYDALFFMAAHEFGGELEARTLFSVSRPFTVTHTPPGGSSRTDSVQAFVGGTLTLVVDSAASSPGPIDLEVVQVIEEWHAPSASWTVRIDTADVRELWTLPGAGSGPVLGAGTWVGGDTLRLTLDSAAVQVWSDSAAARLGGLVRATTPDSRIFFETISFRYDAVPVDVDTVVAVGNVARSRIIAPPDPVAPAPEVLRVGGLPAWRSLIRFRPFTEVRVPCPPSAPVGCTLDLEDVTINLASLLLEPVPAGPRRLERPTWIEARAVLGTSGVPLSRSPLSPPVGQPSDTLSAALFSGATAAPGPVRLPITSYVRRHFDETQEDPVPLWVALTAGAELGQFGYAAFAGLRSDRPPRLRLVLSLPEDVLMR